MRYLVTWDDDSAEVEGRKAAMDKARRISKRQQGPVTVSGDGQVVVFLRGRVGPPTPEPQGSPPAPAPEERPSSLRPEAMAVQEAFRTREGTNKARLLELLAVRMGHAVPVSEMADYVYGDETQKAKVGLVMEGLLAAVKNHQPGYSLEKVAKGRQAAYRLQQVTGRRR